MSKTPKRTAPPVDTRDDTPTVPNSGLPVADATEDPAPAPGPENGKRRGPPLGSKNGRGNIRHGLFAGSLPKDAKHIEHQCNRLRRELEDACLRVRGSVSLTESAMIATAMKWERHGALALRWLRLRGDELKPNEYLAFSQAIARASSERDRAIVALALDRDEQEDAIDALYAQPKRLESTEEEGE